MDPRKGGARSVSATLLLERTSTLQLATGIANVYARDAVTMANTQRALEEAFPGRFMLGLGVSHAHLVDRVRKHDYSKPYSYMVDYLADMDGAVFRAIGPAERPPATVLAALGPKMLELAASAANGAHPYFVPVEHTAVAREIMGPDATLPPTDGRPRHRPGHGARHGPSQHGRVPPGPDYVNNQAVGFTDDDGRRRRQRQARRRDRRLGRRLRRGDRCAPTTTPAPTTWPSSSRCRGDRAAGGPAARAGRRAAGELAVR